MILCDSNVIIDALNGDVNVQKYLLQWPPEDLLISRVTEWEILAGARNKTEQNLFQKALKRYHIVELDAGISAHTGILLKTYHLSHDLMIPDALIAATAIRHNLMLYTDNIKDFQFIKGLRLWVPERN